MWVMAEMVRRHQIEMAWNEFLAGETIQSLRTVKGGMLALLKGDGYRYVLITKYMSSAYPHEPEDFGL